MTFLATLAVAVNALLLLGWSRAGSSFGIYDGLPFALGALALGLVAAITTMVVLLHRYSEDQPQRAVWLWSLGACWPLLALLGKAVFA